MKVTFVQSDKEKREVDRVIADGLSLKKAKVGTWILPPNLSTNGAHGFTVVDCPTGRDVFAVSFDTIDGALLYALGIRDGGPSPVWDRCGVLKAWGSFI